jgi:CRP-like cAMP-binding protein
VTRGAPDASAVRRQTGTDARAERPANALLAALPPDEYARLRPYLTRTDLPFNRVLQRQDEPITHVFFPSGGVLSATHAMSDGRLVEIATVGAEGVANVEAMFGTDVQHHAIVVQVPVEGGYAEVMEAAAFRREMITSAAFRDLMTRYAHAYVVLSAQCTACNALHNVNQRCARWLLMCADRAHQQSFLLSQDYLAAMLAVRRASVSVVAGDLKRKGLIDYRRSTVVIRDRPRLEKIACECYPQMRSVFDRILPAEN